MSVLMCSVAATVTWVGIFYGIVNVLGWLMFEHCVNHGQFCWLRESRSLLIWSGENVILS
jgi:hypothetical protein